MKIGEKIRRERTRKETKLIEVAQRTGFSQSYLSQIERGLINPSVSALQKISQSLGLSTAYFFEADTQNKDGAGAVTVVRQSQRKGLVYPGSNNVVYELLSPDLQRDIEFLMITAPPQGCSGEETFIHSGQECGIVLQGTMEIWVGESQHLLQTGDSIYFTSSNPHKWINVGTTDLIAIWVVTPPSF